uniref:Uncharacterized protein n=1 Tax=Capra hircus TaxID=9925 RepID=A0A8C2QRY9_CAPHI
MMTMTTMADGLEGQDSSKSAFMEFGQQQQQQQQQQQRRGPCSSAQRAAAPRRRAPRRAAGAASAAAELGCLPLGPGRSLHPTTAHY